MVNSQKPAPITTGSEPRRANQDIKARKHDPERTKHEILAAATREFAEHGLSGARVDVIATRTRTTKRMIYYYFGGKEKLYTAVLEKVYAEIRAMEGALRLDQLDPEAAIRRLVEATFEYDEAHPDFIRLVVLENIHHAKYLAASPAIRDLNITAIDTLAAILKRGRHLGVFRERVDPVDVHMMISAFCFFRVSNSATFGTLFGRDLSAPDLRRNHKQMIADAVIHLLQQDREDECPIAENEDVRRRPQQRDGIGLEYCAVEPTGRRDNQPDRQRRHDAGEVGGEN
jgi:AcrR family transcriptional regulator